MQPSCALSSVLPLPWGPSGSRGTVPPTDTASALGQILRCESVATKTRQRFFCQCRARLGVSPPGPATPDSAPRTWPWHCGLEMAARIFQNQSILRLNTGHQQHRCFGWPAYATAARQLLLQAPSNDKSAPGEPLPPFCSCPPFAAVPYIHIKVRLRPGPEPESGALVSQNQAVKAKVQALCSTRMHSAKSSRNLSDLEA
jgi:hypothetical protein